MKDFSWEPYPSNGLVKPGFKNMALFHFNVHSANPSANISDLITSKREFHPTFQAYTSLDPLLSVLDDTKVPYETDAFTQVVYDPSMKR